MAVIRSKHTSPLGLPRGPVIEPGKSVRVGNWHVLRAHPVVSAWIAAGVIEEEAEAATVAPEPIATPVAPVVSAPAASPAESPPVADDVAMLRAEADRLGIKYDGRWGAAKLRQAIAEARG